jgi:hypothetical protein
MSHIEGTAPLTVDRSHEHEDTILTRVALEHALAPLEERDRVMLLMVFRVEFPDEYRGPLPPTYQDIADYIGRKYEGEALAEATIRYRRDALLAVLRGERRALRRTTSSPTAKNPQQPEENRAESPANDRESAPTTPTTRRT